MEKEFQFNGQSHKVIVSEDYTAWEIDLQDEKGYTDVYKLDRIINAKAFFSSDIWITTQKKDKLGNVYDSRMRGFEYRVLEPEFRALWQANLNNVQTEQAAINGVTSRVTNELSTKGEFGIKLFDPTNNFNFAYPITWTVEETERTEGANDGRLEAVISHQQSGGTTEYKVVKKDAQNGDVIIQDWNTNLLVSGLAAGTYMCQIRQTNDFGDGNAVAVGVDYEFKMN